MRKRTALACAVLCGSTVLSGCSDPVDSPTGPAERRVSRAVASTCQTPPYCSPGFDGSLAFSIRLGRGQEVPPIPASAGTGTFALNADSTALTYDIRVEGIPAVSAAHFHNAPAGTNGGVVRALTGSVDDGVWTSAGTWTADETDQPLTPALLAELLAGNLYVNAHSADYPGGEVRGQVLAEGDGFAAVLDRAQEVPARPEPSGTASFRLNSKRTALTYQIRVQGLPQVSAAHFHSAPAGTSGGVVRALTGQFDGDVWVSEGTWTATEATQPLTSALVAELLAGNLYVNVHTPDYPAGEIRGQLLP